MTKREIQAHTHYAPHGYTMVCGFRDKVVARQSESDTPEYPLLKIRTTTNIVKITCLFCAEWVLEQAHTTYYKANKEPHPQV